jgi:hypothetical protein
MNICTEFENGRCDVPNAATIAAIEELERGGGKSFNSIEELRRTSNQKALQRSTLMQETASMRMGKTEAAPNFKRT